MSTGYAQETTAVPSAADAPSMISPVVRSVLALQALYYLVTGLWPLVNIASFQEITGPKTDLWLVWTVGALIALVGAVLFVSAARHRFSVETAVLAIGSAILLMAVDITFVSTRTIPVVYLLDALAEGGLLCLYAVALLSSAS